MRSAGTQGRVSALAAWGRLVAALTAMPTLAQTAMSTTVIPAGTLSAPPSEPLSAAPLPRSFAGRLSVVIQTDPLQQMIADFELEGDASQGELRLFGPFGASLAVLQWDPSRAVLIEGERRRVVRSIDWLIERVTGAPLPVGLIFDWLLGRPVRSDDWEVAPRDRPNAPLRATRLQPLPRIELTLAIKTPTAP